MRIDLRILIIAIDELPTKHVTRSHGLEKKRRGAHLDVDGGIAQDCQVSCK